MDASSLCEMGKEEEEGKGRREGWRGETIEYIALAQAWKKEALGSGASVAGCVASCKKQV